MSDDLGAIALILICLVGLVWVALDWWGGE